MVGEFTKELDSGCFLVYKIDKLISGMFEGGNCHFKIIKTFGRNTGGFFVF